MGRKALNSSPRSPLCRQRRKRRRSFTLTHFSLKHLPHNSKQGVTQPPVEPKLVTAKYGFVDNAERINSRAAMVSLIVSVAAFCLFSPFLSLSLLSRSLRTTTKKKTSKNPPQMGFFGILLVELVAGKGIFEIVGIPVGNGLGFSF